MAQACNSQGHLPVSREATRSGWQGEPVLSGGKNRKKSQEKRKGLNPSVSGQKAGGLGGTRRDTVAQVRTILGRAGRLLEAV